MQRGLMECAIFMLRMQRKGSIVEICSKYKEILEYIYRLICSRYAKRVDVICNFHAECLWRSVANTRNYCSVKFMVFGRIAFTLHVFVKTV